MSSVDILLTTLNSTYAHCALGLRYLAAQLGPLLPRTRILEFNIGQKPLDIVESLLAHEPRIVAIGVYIWNAQPTGELVALLKRVRPDLIVVLGGPEVSFEGDAPPMCQLADYVIAGEAEQAFSRLCADLLEGQRPPEKFIHPALPNLDELALPYDLYDEADIAHRAIYVETTRGCPFSCQYCLSSRDIPLRRFPLARVLPALDQLLERGATQLRFVDRSFNAAGAHSVEVLRFLLARSRADRLFHLEVRADLLDQESLDLLAQFPAGALQLEIGIQTFNQEVAKAVSRPFDEARTEEALRLLRAHTQVHIHADLIAGLPGESWESFARGFDRLLALAPHEIQVGILKRLRGSALAGENAPSHMVYSPVPPYEILQNNLLSLRDLQRLRRFGQAWDTVANSGNFPRSKGLLCDPAGSPFVNFVHFADWLFARAGRVHSIALQRLSELIFIYLTTEKGLPREATALALWHDYRGGGRRELLEFLKDLVPRELWRKPPPPSISHGSGKRQARHRGAGLD